MSSQREGHAAGRGRQLGGRQRCHQWHSGGRGTTALTRAAPAWLQGPDTRAGRPAGERGCDGRCSQEWVSRQFQARRAGSMLATARGQQARAGGHSQQRLPSFADRAPGASHRCQGPPCPGRRRPPEQGAAAAAPPRPAPRPPPPPPLEACAACAPAGAGGPCKPGARWGPVWARGGLRDWCRLHGVHVHGLCQPRSTGALQRRTTRALLTGSTARRRRSAATRAPWHRAEQGRRWHQEGSPGGVSSAAKLHCREVHAGQDAGWH